MGKYSAIGAIIPLTKWFDMKRPGDYTVVVTLQAPDEQYHRAENGHWVPERGPFWVAEPIKVHVPFKARGG